MKHKNYWLIATASLALMMGNSRNNKTLNY